MKKYSKYIIGGLCVLSVAFSAGSFMKVNAAAASAVVPAQPVDLTYAAEKALSAVVHIRFVQNSKVQTVEVQSDPFSDFFSDPFGFFGNPGQGNGGKQKRQVQTPKREATGSGVIISADGYIVTNNHVVEGADQLTVTLNDNREFSARIIGTDKNTDLALIKVDGKNLPTLPIGDSDKLKVGEWVLAVGNPFNLNSTVTAGIVSAKARSLGGNPIESFIQTDAAVNAGNSGGALVNTKGELIGINTAIYSETGNFAGYSFAVPISIAGKVVADLKQYGTVQRAILGVVIQNAQAASQNDKKVKELEGAYVAEFAQRSSAKEAGVEVGDVITSVNGVRIRSNNALQEQISKYRPGDKVKLEVNRYGAIKDFTVELRNSQGGTDVVKKSGDAAEMLGAAFRELSDAQKKEYGVSYGIEVNGISKGKVQEAGIRKGFIIMVVNDQKISTPEDLFRIVEKIQKGSSEEQGLFIRGFYPDGRTRLYAINFSE
mgnify:CR=1 FL=1